MTKISTALESAGIKHTICKGFISVGNAANVFTTYSGKVAVSMRGFENGTIRDASYKFGSYEKIVARVLMCIKAHEEIETKKINDAAALLSLSKSLHAVHEQFPDMSHLWRIGRPNEKGERNILLSMTQSVTKQQLIFMLGAYKKMLLIQ